MHEKLPSNNRTLMKDEHCIHVVPESHFRVQAAHQGDQILLITKVVGSMEPFARTCTVWYHTDGLDNSLTM
jgi:hypothetical protein